MTKWSPQVGFQIGVGLSEVQFSTNSPLIVPGMNGRIDQPVVFQPMVRNPNGFYEFLHLCNSFLDESGGSEGEEFDEQYVETRVGSAGLASNGFGIRVAYPDLEDVDNTWMSFVMEELGDASYGEVQPLRAELNFGDLRSPFAVRQFSRMEAVNKGKGLKPSRANGLGTMAIVSGIGLIDEAGVRGVEYEDDTWINVAHSMANGITPLTALYIASLFAEELFPYDDIHEMEMDVMDLASGESLYVERPVYPSPDGSLLVPRDIDLESLKDFEVSFVSVRSGHGFYPRDPVMGDSPSVTVRYIPAEEGSTVFFDEGFDHPLIEIVQNVMFNPRGAEPFAGVIADLVGAAARLRPGIFPLRGSTRRYK